LQNVGDATPFSVEVGLSAEMDQSYNSVEESDPLVICDVSTTTSRPNAVGTLVVVEQDIVIMPGSIEKAAEMAMQARDDQFPSPNKMRSFAASPVQSKGKSVVSEFMKLKFEERAERIGFEQHKWTLERSDREEDLKRAEKRQKMEDERQLNEKIENRRFLLAQNYMIECARNGNPINDIPEFLKKFNL
jgi:hypothetical protein